VARPDLDAMVAVALAHAAAAAACDLDRTMATLNDDPVYELLPRGVVLHGRDAARRYYEHFFTNVMPRVTGFELRSEWVTDDGVLQEYTLFVDGLGEPGTGHSIIGILTFGNDGKLSGERIYASDALLEFMFGPVLGEAEPR
jgi:ketosteroid isomerase-like protein